MLEFGTQNTSQVPATDLIKDSSEMAFMTDVIEASQEVPVIVDFWATWCGPCKQLTPALEQAVTAYKGAVKLVKIDVDQNQAIAAQLRIQSVPTVFIFWQGQPYDAFQGNVAPSQIKQFIDKMLKISGTEGTDGGLDDAVIAAEEMLAQGAVTDAAQTFAAILGEQPDHAGAYAGLIKAHIVIEDFDKAEALLASVPETIAEAPEIEAVRAQLALARQAADAGPLGELRAAIEADPNNHQARFDLATALHAAGETEEAVEALLELFRRDREWDNGAAKTQLFTIFDALKPEDPIVLKGRRKLSSMIFA